MLLWTPCRKKTSFVQSIALKFLQEGHGCKKWDKARFMADVEMLFQDCIHTYLPSFSR